MKKDKVSININNNETKSEIVYNNIVSNMDNMNISKDEQIEYLKNRVSELENDQKLKFDFAILGLSSLLLLVIGITFLILNFYFIGSFIVLLSFGYVGYKTYKLSNCNSKINLDKFEEIEVIRKMIDSKLK